MNTAATVRIPTPDQAIERCGLMIKRTALHLAAVMPWADVDDLIQWGVLGLLEVRERFDPSRGATFEAFAARRVRGAMIDSLRRDGNQSRRVNRAPDQVEVNTLGHSASYEDPLTQILGASDMDAVTAAIDALPERARLVLQLFFVEGLNNREVAGVIGASEPSVSRTRTRALRLISTRLHADRPAGATEESETGRGASA